MKRFQGKKKYGLRNYNIEGQSWGKQGREMKRLRNNRMFWKNKGMYYRKINDTNEMRRAVPDIDKFVEFWAGICKDERRTLHG